MFLFYVLSFFKKGDSIQGGTLFKEGDYLRKYGTLHFLYNFILFSGSIETVKVISVYTALDRIGVNRRLRNDTSTSEEIGIVANNGDIMETYLDFAAHRGDIEIFKHIYNLSTKGRWPRKTRKSIKSFKLLKNSKGRTPDYFANGAFKQEILKFIQKNR